MNRGSTVVVGVDGSAASAGALRAAVDEARTRGGEVEMVTAWTWPADRQPDLVAYHSGRAWAVHAQTATLEQADLGSRHRPPMTSVIVDGDPAATLARAGRGAVCIVVGRGRQHGGSLGTRCRELAACPVLEVPEVAQPPGPGGPRLPAQRRVTRTSSAALPSDTPPMGDHPRRR